MLVLARDKKDLTGGDENNQTTEATTKERRDDDLQSLIRKLSRLSAIKNPTADDVAEVGDFAEATMFRLEMEARSPVEIHSEQIIFSDKLLYGTTHVAFSIFDLSPETKTFFNSLNNSEGYIRANGTCVHIEDGELKDNVWDDGLASEATYIMATEIVNS